MFASKMRFLSSNYTRIVKKKKKNPKDSKVTPSLLFMF